MKLAKKAFAVVVAIALISTLAISAFATDATASLSLSADKPSVEIGDNVTVTLAINNAAGLTNGGFTLTYDSAVLQYVSHQDVNAAAMAVGLVSEGTFNAGVMYAEAATDANITVCSVTFKTLQEGDTNLTLGVLNGDIDGVTIDSDASLTISVTEQTTAAPTEPTEAPAPDDTDPSETPSDDGKDQPIVDEIPKTGDAGIAVAAGLVVLAGAAFVASKKRK